MKSKCSDRYLHGRRLNMWVRILLVELIPFLHSQSFGISHRLC
jgi:hypothetical protein